MSVLETARENSGYVVLVFTIALLVTLGVYEIVSSLQAEWQYMAGWGVGAVLTAFIYSTWMFYAIPWSRLRQVQEERETA